MIDKAIWLSRKKTSGVLRVDEQYLDLFREKEGIKNHVLTGEVQIILINRHGCPKLFI